MSLLALAFAAHIGLQSPAPAAIPPDRSGEPELRKILSWGKSLNNVHVAILKKARESETTPMYPDSRVDVWISGPKFRVESSNMWDGGSTVVSDGSTVLSDSNSEYEPVIVANAKGGLVATMTDLKLAPEEMSPFFFLLSGPDQLDKLVEKTAAIKAEPGKAVWFEHKKLGTVKLFYHEEKGSIRLERIDFDNKPWLKEQHEKYPEWMDEPDAGTLTRHEIVMSFERTPGSLFQPKPAKGRAVEDRRKKAGAGLQE